MRSTLSMLVHGIKTRILVPPQDDMYAMLEEMDLDLQERDVLLVSSKILAIHHGRCVPFEDIEKGEVIAREADYLHDYGHRKYPLTIKHNAFISSGGVDSSNGNGHYVLPPEHPFDDAKELWNYFRKRFSLEELGIIITDSYSMPLRMGSQTISIGFWGIAPLRKYQGTEDLFGREFKVSRVNIIDSLAANSGLVSGEGSESSPLTLIRDVPDIVFSDEYNKDKLFVKPEEDRFYPLLKKFYE